MAAWLPKQLAQEVQKQKTEKLRAHVKSIRQQFCGSQNVGYSFRMLFLSMLLPDPVISRF